MKFSIRDLLLVTVIVALSVAACLTQLDRLRLAKENGRLRQILKARQAEFGEYPGDNFEEHPGNKESAKNTGKSESLVPQGSSLPPSSFGGPPNSSAPAPNPPND